MTTEEFEAKRKEILAGVREWCLRKLERLECDRVVLNGELANMQWRLSILDEREKDLRERLEVANRG